MRTTIATFTVLMSIAACGGGGEDEFIAGRSNDPCLQTIPACPGLFAACVLNDSKYARTSFPGDFRFIVKAKEDHEIEVMIYFASQRDAGLETQIFWNEPGCTEVYHYESGGRNLFADSEDLGFIAEKQELLETGEHLIEIFSDMQADVIVAVNVIVPGTR